MMILLAKLPSQIKEIIYSYNQKTIDAMTLTFATICNDAIINWQQHSSKENKEILKVSIQRNSIYSAKARILFSSSSTKHSRTKCHNLAKWLSHYLYFFSFLFLLDLLHRRSAEKYHVTSIT